MPSARPLSGHGRLIATPADFSQRSEVTKDGPTYREPAPGPDGITSVQVLGEFDVHDPKIVRLLGDGFFPNQQRTYLRELEKALA
ncbi:hypothetical protein [Streptomyces sp. NPDC002078]